jgi:hypothetical protein
MVEEDRIEIEPDNDMADMIDRNVQSQSQSRYSTDVGFDDDDDDMMMPPTQSEDEIKKELLRRMYYWQQSGQKIPKKLNMSHSLEEVEMIYGNVQHARRAKSSINMYKKMYYLLINGVEMAALKFGNGKVRLKGWKESIEAGMDQYDPIFEEIYYTHADVFGEMDPIMKLAIMTIASAAVFHMHAPEEISEDEKIATLIDNLETNPQLLNQLKDRLGLTAQPPPPLVARSQQPPPGPAYVPQRPPQYSVRPPTAPVPKPIPPPVFPIPAKPTVAGGPAPAVPDTMPKKQVPITTTIPPPLPPPKQDDNTAKTQAVREAALTAEIKHSIDNAPPSDTDPLIDALFGGEKFHDVEPPPRAEMDDVHDLDLQDGTIATPIRPGIDVIESVSEEKMTVSIDADAWKKAGKNKKKKRAKKKPDEIVSFD